MDTYVTIPIQYGNKLRVSKTIKLKIIEDDGLIALQIPLQVFTAAVHVEQIHIAIEIRTA
jgi:hypothetical protein